MNRKLTTTHTAYEISALSVGEISPIVLVYSFVLFITRCIFIKSLFGDINCSIDILALPQGVISAADDDMVAVSRSEEFWLHAQDGESAIRNYLCSG